MLAVLKALHTVLIPVKAANGFKPTIATAQDHMFYMAKTIEEALEELERLNISEYEGPNTPKIIALGNNIESASGVCIVAFGNTQYKLPSVARAIDVYVKITTVFKLPPSKISKLIWEFILKFVYSNEKTSAYVSVKKLISFIETCSSPAV